MEIILRKLINHQDLIQEEIEEVMLDIMNGELSDIEIAGFLVALQSKGPTVNEITGCAKIMREKSVKISPKVDVLVDTCGTGGDKSFTFNISTAVALVVAACGVSVAKHGNRAASSKCGSADVLEALGVNINLPPEQIQKCIEEVGIGFMFAPLFHPAMKYVMPARKKLGIKTIFNILGPITNPAGVLHQVIGVFDPNLTEVLAEVLKNLGSKHTLVVHGEGLDEITTTGKTKITELENGKLNTYFIQPEDFGMERSSLDDLRGGNSDKNAEIILRIIKGEEKGSKRDIVLLNSAAVLLSANKVSRLSEGLEKVRDVLGSGAALAKLKEFKYFTNQ